MPVMRVAALAAFFFPSSRYKKARTHSRPRSPGITISRNHGSNIYPCIWLTSTGTRAPSTCHIDHRHSYRDDKRGAMNSGAEDYYRGPRSDPGASGWSESTKFDPEEAHGGDIPHPHTYPSRHPNTERRSNGTRAPKCSGNHDIPRFSLHVDAFTHEQTCFVGTSPGSSSASPQYFHDQTIRFRVIDMTRYQEGGEMAQGEGEMLIVSSPANIPWIVETLAPRGSGRRAIIQARVPHGSVQHGDLQYLATILPKGWPFDVLLEDE